MTSCGTNIATITIHNHRSVTTKPLQASDHPEASIDHPNNALSYPSRPKGILFISRHRRVAFEFSSYEHLGSTRKCPARRLGHTHFVVDCVHQTMRIRQHLQKSPDHPLYRIAKCGCVFRQYNVIQTLTYKTYTSAHQKYLAIHQHKDLTHMYPNAYETRRVWFIWMCTVQEAIPWDNDVNSLWIIRYVLMYMMCGS